jgi:hypothetical protein
MLSNGFTNGDRMLQVVLNDSELATYGEYNPSDYETIEEALASDKPIVVAVAKMIQGLQRKSNDKEIYNEVNNYLRNNLI